MNKTITNEYAQTIIDNRWIATAQLDADDMGKTAWKQYRQICDNIAIASWNSLCHKTDAEDNTLALSVSALFALVESDAKAIPAMQKRFILACVTYKKEQSIAMKKARKMLKDDKAKLEEAQEAEIKDETYITIMLEKVEADKAEIERLEGEPMNVWYNKTPNLTKDRKHATPKCRKFIEDTLADILTERSLMTVEELQKEAQELADQRKGRKIRKEKEAKAKAEAETKAE